eukprot:4858673-Ditylum_brightwellii.AAC.1
MLSLDLKNMFNTMSREKCRHVLSTKFPHLLCLFDALYRWANKVHVRKEDGTLETFLQFEGFALGCPLSGVFSALVLGEVLKHLNEGQSDCSLHAANPQDDVDDLISKLLAFIDDTNAVVPHQDVAWIFYEIRTIDITFGCQSSKKKTKILTTITGSSLLLHLPQETAEELNRTINTYTKGEVTTVLTILSLPIG